MTTLELNDIKDIVLKNTKAKDCEIVSFQLVPLSDDIAGFLGEHLILKIEYKIDNGLIHKVQFFIKKCPQNYSEYSDFTEQAFCKENFFYETLIKLFQKHHFYSSKRFDPHFTAKHYFSKNNGIIVLEDLSTQGYKLPKITFFDMEHLNLLTKITARLHAGSFLYEEFQTKKTGKPYRLIDDYENMFVEPLFQGPKGLAPIWGWLLAGLHTVLCLIDEKFGTVNEEGEKLKIFCTNLAYRMDEVMKSQRSTFRNVASHGDLWINNTMFLYNENEKPIDCKIIDFQMLRYAPPAHDAMFPLFVTVDRKFRQKHLNDYLKLYYKCLTQELDNLGLSLRNILPLQEFEDTCKYYLPYLIATKMFYLTVMRVDSEYLKEINKKPGELADFLFKDRCHGLLKLYRENGKFREFMDDLLEDLYELLTGNDKNNIKLV